MARPTSERPGVELRRHPAERRPTPSVVLPQVACCCSCCCCLHSVGGLIGGILGSVVKLPEEPKPVDPDFPFPFRRDELENEQDLVPATGLYWALVLFVFSCVAIWYGFFDRPRSVVVGIVAALVFLPAIQLGASVLAAVVIAAFYTDKANALNRLGRITLLSFVGTLIGIGIMAGLCGVFLLPR